MEWLTSPEALVSLLTLTLLEIVLGVDNIIFISILVGRLPDKLRERARILGLALAMISRILLLLSITWVMQLEARLFTVLGEDISGRDLILLGGGLFLLAKATLEIHTALEGEQESPGAAAGTAAFGAVLVQIAVLDIVFSLDSVITAVGLAEHVEIMVLAILIAVGVMMFAARPIGEFVDTHPTFKMLALSFLVLVGVTLIGEGLGMHVPKGYVYFAMAFSVSVEVLNLKIRAAREPLRLRKRLTDDAGEA